MTNIKKCNRCGNIYMMTCMTCGKPVFGILIPIKALDADDEYNLCDDCLGDLIGKNFEKKPELSKEQKQLTTFYELINSCENLSEMSTEHKFNLLREYLCVLYDIPKDEIEKITEVKIKTKDRGCQYDIINKK